jgi:hypothetical protein
LSQLAETPQQSDAVINCVEEIFSVESGPGPDRLTAQSELIAFPNAQLDELLIQSQPSQKEQHLGYLKKVAFVRYYIDGLSQREILTTAIED